MVDYLVSIWDDLHESFAIQAMLFCFDNASPKNSCFVIGLDCFVLLCLQVAVFLNATRKGEQSNISNEDFPGEALTNQKTQSLSILTFKQLVLAPTKWSATFAFGVFHVPFVTDKHM